MKEVSIEKLSLARAARIKVRENIQEAFGALEQLDKSIANFSEAWHLKLHEIEDCVINIEDSLDFENGINEQTLNLIDFYLEHKYCSDYEMAELIKEVNNINRLLEIK